MTCVFSCAPRATLILGKEKTGKTARLADRARFLIDEGVSAADIAAFAASPDAARAMRRALTATHPALTDVRVLVPRELALEVLARPEAQAFTGRRPRVLARFEESFLMEDLKVSAVRPGRIRALMGFFRKGWSDLADFDENWLIFAEERDLHDLVKQTLASYRAFFEDEVSNAACRFLLHHDSEWAHAGIPHVLVDDYQCLSRASQHLVNLLASESIAVAANPAACIEAYESYPYAEGVREFAEAHVQPHIERLETSFLPAGVKRALDRLEVCAGRDDGESAARASADGGVGAGGGTGASASADSGVSVGANAGSDVDIAFAASVPDIVSCTTPADECAQVCAWVASTLKAGVRPDEVAVVVPNRTWERNIARALRREGVPVREGGQTGNVGGDIRYDDLSRAAQFITLLTLAAHPEDEAALRAWCGFGDYLTCRSLFSEVLPWCREGDPSLAQILADIRQGIGDGTLEKARAITFMGDAEKVAARLNHLARALAAVQGLAGDALVQTLADQVAECEDADVPAAVAGLLRDMGADDDAAALCERVRREMLYPHLPETEGVALIVPQRCVGLDATAAALAGMVNGFCPPHVYFDRTKTSPERARTMLAREAVRHRAALALGARQVALFSFETVRGTDAERQSLHVERFFVKDGTRYARLSRSLLVDVIEGVPVG